MPSVSPLVSDARFHDLRQANSCHSMIWVVAFCVVRPQSLILRRFVKEIMSETFNSTGFYRSVAQRRYRIAHTSSQSLEITFLRQTNGTLALTGTKETRAILSLLWVETLINNDIAAMTFRTSRDWLIIKIRRL